MIKRSGAALSIGYVRFASQPSFDWHVISLIPSMPKISDGCVWNLQVWLSLAP
jgi:hypothetical protein